MKRLFIVLALCCLMVSCQWWHETFDSPKECVSWYLEQLRSAVENGDADAIDDLVDDLFDYCLDLEDNEDWELASCLIKEFEDKYGNIEDLSYTLGKKGLVSGSKLDRERVEYERAYSPKRCAVWYMEQLYDANKRGDSELVEDLADCFFAYCMKLDGYDVEAVYEVVYQYERRYGCIDAIYYAFGAESQACDVAEECAVESCDDYWAVEVVECATEECCDCGDEWYPDTYDEIECCEVVAESVCEPVALW